MATPIPQNEASFTLSEVASITGGQLLPGSDPDATLRGVSLDSRRLRQGNLFVALVGEHHDAHRFVDAARSAGAAVLVQAEHPLLAATPGLVGVAVPDTLRALGDVAHAHRQRWGGRVVGITGSAGKTTTKRLMAAGLRGAGARVWSTPGNLNNRVGVPMTLLLLGSEHDLAVIEMGTSEPGEIARLAEIAAPDVAIVTRVAVSHTAGLGTLEDVAREKGALFAALNEDHIAVGFADDYHVARALEACPAGTKIAYGVQSTSNLRIDSQRLVHGQTLARFVREADAERPPLDVEVTLSMLGDAAAQNAAAVIAVTDALGLDLEGACRALAQVTPEPGRFAPQRLRGDRLVIDDTYNANPASTEMAIQTATTVARAQGSALVAVLGDMKELGRVSVSEHRAVGATLVRAGVRLLITCGPEMRAAARAARERGVRVHEVQCSEAARLAAMALVRDNDVVLVKGSRSMQMERVVQGLVALGGVGNGGEANS